MSTRSKRCLAFLLTLTMLIGTVSMACFSVGAETNKVIKVDINNATDDGVGYLNLCSSVVTDITAEDCYLSYKIYMTEDKTNCTGLEIANGDGNMRDSAGVGILDQNGISCHAAHGDISDYAVGQWYERHFALDGCAFAFMDGATVVIEYDGFANGSTTYYLDDICIKSKSDDSVLASMFVDGGAEYSYIGTSYTDNNAQDKYTVTVVDDPTIAHPAAGTVVTLDDCTDASRWSCRDVMASDGNHTLNIWWELESCVTFDAPKDITNVESVSLDFTGSTGQDNTLESLFSGAQTDPSLYGVVLTSATNLPTGNGGANGSTQGGTEVNLSSEAFTTYGVRLNDAELVASVISGVNTYSVDWSTAGSKFDASKVTGIAICSDGTRDMYISGITATIGADEPEEVTLPITWDAEDFAAATVDGAEGTLLTSNRAMYAASTADNDAVAVYEPQGVPEGSHADDGSGMYATFYPNTTVAVTEGSDYTVTVKLRVDGALYNPARYLGYPQLYIRDPDTVMAPSGADRWVASSYEAAELKYDETYGYAYKELSYTLTATASGDALPCYIYSDNGAQTLYSISVSADGSQVYTEDFVNITEVGEDATTSYSPYYYSIGYKTGLNYKAIAGTADALLIGGMNASLKEGNYTYTADVAVSNVKAGNLFTAKVIDAEINEVASITYTDADVVDGVVKVDVPFTAAEGSYSFEITVNDNCDLVIPSVTLKNKVNNRGFVISDCESLDGFYPWTGDGMTISTAEDCTEEHFISGNHSEGSASIYSYENGGPYVGYIFPEAKDFSQIETITFDLYSTHLDHLLESSFKGIALTSNASLNGDGEFFYEPSNPATNSIWVNDGVYATYDTSSFVADDWMKVTVTVDWTTAGANFDRSAVNGFCFYSYGGLSGHHCSYIDNIAAVSYDENVANAVIDTINALPAVDDITLADEATVAAARADYDALTADQKEIVSNLSVLTDAEAKIYDLKNVYDKFVIMQNFDNIEGIVDGAGNEASSDGDFLVVNAGVAHPICYVRVGGDGTGGYDHSFNFNDYYQCEVLTDSATAQNFMLSAGNEDNAREYQFMANVSAAAGVSRVEAPVSSFAIQGPSQVDENSIGLDNVNLMFFTYDGDSNTENTFKFNDLALVTKEYADARSAAETAFTAAVAAILTSDDVDAAVTNANEKKAEVEKFINYKTDSFNAAVAAVDTNAATAKAGKVAVVKELINNLPAVTDIKITDKAAVVAARNAYDALDEALKADVDNYTVLTDAEAKIAELEGGAAYDQFLLIKDLDDLNGIVDGGGNNAYSADGKLVVDATANHHPICYIRAGSDGTSYVTSFNFNDWYQLEVMTESQNDVDFYISAGNEDNQREYQFICPVSATAGLSLVAAPTASFTTESPSQIGEGMQGLDNVNLLFFTFRGDDNPANTMKFDNIALVTEAYVNARANAVSAFVFAVDAITGEDDTAGIAAAKAAKEEVQKYINYGTADYQAAVSKFNSIAKVGEGKIIKVTVDTTKGNNANAAAGYLNLTAAPTVQMGDCLEYDVYLMDDVSGIGGLDYCTATENCRDYPNPCSDQNGISAHPKSDISDYAYGQWYSRKYTLNEGVRDSDGMIVLAYENFAGSATFYIDNIRITRDGEIVGYCFKDDSGEYSFDGTGYSDGTTNYGAFTVSVVDAADMPAVTHADLVNAFTSKMDSLPTEVQTSDKEAIEACRAAYNNLPLDDAKLVVSLEKLEAAEKGLEEAFAQKAEADKKAAQTVIDMISNLPSISSLKVDDKAAVQAARNAFGALSADQKTYVTNINTLTNAEQAIADLEIKAAAKTAVEEKIAAITATGITEINDDNLGQYTTVTEAARKAYDDFVAQYGADDTLDITVLTDAEKMIADYNSVLYGDLDGSGEVDSKDALIVLQSCVDKVTLTDAQKLAADVNGDGVVDSKDALAILQKVVGKIALFPVEEAE